MIPDENYDEYENEDEEMTDYEVESDPSLTYQMQTIDDETTEDNLFVGKIDEEDAVKQAILKILNTERFEYEIYSEEYGIELQDLFGESMIYCMAELPSRIEDALLSDDRIESVSDFDVEQIDSRSIHVSFTVTLVQDGEQLEIESEVEV